MSVTKNLTFITGSLQHHVCVFFNIRIFDSDLDINDKNTLVSEFSENDDSEVEVVDSSGIGED